MHSEEREKREKWTRSRDDDIRYISKSTETRMITHQQNNKKYLFLKRGKKEEERKTKTGKGKKVGGKKRK